MAGNWHNNVDLEGELAGKCKLVNERIGSLVNDWPGIEPRMREAFRYILESPGKRIRAAIVMFCCELVGGEVNAESVTAAAAIEMVHAYSLVHDDLPAMDDDDMRRGRASCHVQFDEAVAILAGDGLLTLAFEVLATEIADAKKSVRLIKELSRAAGAAGMIAGQAADLAAENSEGTKEQLEYIHLNKTAKMFKAAAAMGAICGNADEKQYDLLSDFGLKIGLGFQIADDILDVSSTSKDLGKTAGKDKQANKVTYPSVFGLDESKTIFEEITEGALDDLEKVGGDSAKLKQLTDAMLKRTR